jgi:hypothetical protein
LAGWALPKAFHETEHQKGVVVTAMGPIGHGP